MVKVSTLFHTVAAARDENAAIGQIYPLRRPQLVVDVEDTLFVQKEDTIKALNKKYGTNIGIDEITSFLVQDIFKAKHGIVIERPEIIDIHRRLWADGPQMIHPDIPQRLSRIGREYEIVIVTASVADDPIVIAHLKSNGIKYDGFKTVSSGSEKVKLYPNSFGCVEDSISVVSDFAQNGKVGILMEYPWNRPENPNGHAPGIISVKSWKEAEEALLGTLLQDARR